MMAPMDVQKNQEIGKRLKDARLERGFSQWQLCQKLGFKSTRILAKYENGTFPMPEDLVARCAKELGVAADYILEGEKMAMNTMTTVPKPQIAVVKPDVVMPAKGEDEKVSKKPIEHDDLVNYLWIKKDVFNQILKDASLSRKECAELIGFSPKSVGPISNWANGKARMAMKYITVLCDYAGRDVMDLIDVERNIKEPMVKHVEGVGKIIVKNRFYAQAEKLLEKEEPKSAAIEKPVETIVELKKEETAMPELITVSDRPIPVNAEQIFCKNVKFYISERKLDENKFLEKVGASEKYLDDVIKHNYKIPMAVTLKIARELGISVEDLATDDKAFKIEQEILELEKRMKDLRAMIGIA